MDEIDDPCSAGSLRSSPYRKMPVRGSTPEDPSVRGCARMSPGSEGARSFDCVKAVDRSTK
jgi:hypothetical protein